MSNPYTAVIRVGEQSVSVVLYMDPTVGGLRHVTATAPSPVYYNQPGQPPTSLVVFCPDPKIRGVNLNVGPPSDPPVSYQQVVSAFLGLQNPGPPFEVVFTSDVTTDDFGPV